MSLPDAAPIITAALSLSLALNVAYTWALARCRCPKCGFHQNEHRMHLLRQKELVHDAEHQGFGPGPKHGPKPDIYSCRDEHCSRNPRKVE